MIAAPDLRLLRLHSVQVQGVLVKQHVMKVVTVREESEGLRALGPFLSSVF